MSISIATHERLYVLSNLVADPPKPKLTLIHRAVSKLESVQAGDVKVKTVAPQKDVDGGEGDALIAIDIAVSIAKRLHQRGPLPAPVSRITWKSGFSKPR